jgi:hypothetical protein
LINYPNPVPGLTIKVFSQDGNAGKFIELSFDPQDWAPGSFEHIGNYLTRKFSGLHRFKVVRGGPDKLVPRTEVGLDRQAMPKRIQKTGKALALLKFIYTVFKGCSDKCTEKQCSSDSSEDRGSNSGKKQ